MPASLFTEPGSAVSTPSHQVPAWGRALEVPSAWVAALLAQCLTCPPHSEMHALRSLGSGAGGRVRACLRGRKDGG